MGALGWIATGLVGMLVGAFILAYGIAIGRELGQREREVTINFGDDDDDLT